jgi:membrane fusion protein (multidrug efflux system)
MKTKTKLWLATGAGLLVIVLGLVGVKAAQIGSMISAGKHVTPPPEAVTSAQVVATKWRPSTSATGSIVAVRGVTVGAELPGVVREIGFDSGASVKRGAVLVRLDTSTEEAQLDAAQADAKLARINRDRARTLRAREANAISDLDTAEAKLEAADAAVASLRATINKKTIRAPFDGRVAIRQVELGQAVPAGGAIASLQSVDPIYVEFWLPQQSLATVADGQQVLARSDTFPDATWKGRVSTVNTEVDVSTRNVKVRATLDNPDGRLRPGMFANVEVLADDERPVLSIPATAVMYAPYGDSVFIIDQKPGADGKPNAVARQQFVRLGERRGDLVAVATGLSAGETIVSSGAFKLRNGMNVVVNNELAPKAELAPTPTDR